MKRSFCAALLFALPLCGCAGGRPYEKLGKDAYGSFAELAASNTAGLDYATESYDRGGRVSVLAPHGGDLETHTDAVARRIAGKDFNLYVFRALAGWPASRRLHVTSVRFDDPAALALSSAAAAAVSVHAQAERGEWVCVGGSGAAFRRIVSRRLSAAGFETEEPCARLPGTSPKNLVNLPPGGGVQLELTHRLLERLAGSPERMEDFAAAVRAAALEYVAQLTGEKK